MSIDTHLDGVQVLFERPPEGIETMPILLSRPQPAPFFTRLQLYFVRVVDEDTAEDAPTAHYNGQRVYFHPALAWNG